LKPLDTHVAENSQQPNENLRVIDVQLNAKEIREILDGLLLNKQGYERIKQPDDFDAAKIEFLKVLIKEFSHASQRAKNLMGLNDVID
jgi:hypothetical protein